jgi:hypothetical protein
MFGLYDMRLTIRLLFLGSKNPRLPGGSNAYQEQGYSSTQTKLQKPLMHSDPS